MAEILEPPPAPPPTKPATSRKEPFFRVEVATPSELSRRLPEWQKLADAALVANPFYESWMLMPALSAFADPATTFVVLVYLDDGSSSTLTGLAPFEKFGRFHGIPCRGLALWKHLHGPLATPLLHRDHARETLGAMLDWAAGQARIIDLDLIDAERSFGHVLTDVLNERRAVSSVEDQFNRAFLRPRETADAYIALSQGSRQRQEYRRQRRRLSEQGAFTSRVLGAKDSVEPWLEQFFRLEAAGWKGTEKTALATQPREQEFFRSIVTSAHAMGRLHMLGLFLGDQAVALKCNFLAGGGGFALKIAYDENYSKYSPGVLLELDNIEDVHRDNRIGWMDSCACANHPMIDRLWLERRAMQRRVVSTGSRWGNFVLGLTALGRALKRTIRGT